MQFSQIDPVCDPRWDELVQTHPKASIFHTVGWLRNLRSTYGYEPVVFTTSSPTGQLKNGLVFCRIKSWLTGHRLVSLPFSDHCEPLCESGAELDFLVQYLQSMLNHEEWKYLEVRPIADDFGRSGRGVGFTPTSKYYLHRLDLRPDTDMLFGSLDKDSVQRRIQRAERAGLVEECGNSGKLLRDFYGLFVATRGRHQLPPIPFAWFQNLMDNQREAAEIRAAYCEGRPIAAILTLKFRDVVYYKYGCSEQAFNKYGAMPWLLWRAIAAAKSAGAMEFDMGRTEEDNAGLLAFKNHWVPQPQELTYWTFPVMPAVGATNGWKMKMAKRVFSYMPERLLAFTGKMIYRHIG